MHTTRPRQTYFRIVCLEVRRGNTEYSQAPFNVSATSLGLMAVRDTTFSHMGINPVILNCNLRPSAARISAINMAALQISALLSYNQFIARIA